MSADKAAELGLEPMCTIVSYGWTAGEFTNLCNVPANSMLDALAKADLKVSDIDLWEFNEAFASVCLALLGHAGPGPGDR